MKLDWEINECRVLKAKVGETTYFVSPGAMSLCTPSKQYIGFDGKVATVWPVEGGMSLTNAIAWCERDVERPEECPAQPIVPDAPAAETARKMSGKASKFPSTMDAKSWAARLKMRNTPESLYSVSQLTEWFAAALQRGYLQGVGEAEQKQGDREAAMRRFLALAPATREKFLEVAMAETPARTMTASQYLAWEQMNAAPPSTQAPEPSSVEERAADLKGQSLDDLRGELKRLKREVAALRPKPQSVEDRLARLESELSEWAKYYGAELIRVEGKGEIKRKELSDRIDKQPEPGPFPADRLRDMARRIAELESWLGTKKYAPEDNLASKTWIKLEQLTNRLEKLEART